MRKEMGLENHKLQAPEYQGQGFFCIFVHAVFVYPVMWSTLSSKQRKTEFNKEKSVSMQRQF